MSTPLSLTGKRWVFPSDNLPEGSISRFLAAERGINLSVPPTWGALCDPKTLGDLPRAVERIRKAIEKKERVGVIGDYDADGITGTAQLVRFFRRRGIEPEVILPHRQKHGYGIKREFIDALHAKGVTLILTVDTGISHAKEVREAGKLGMDVIITDHHTPRTALGCMAGHTPRADLPDALIVHPTAKNEHGNPDLCGSGVVFTLVRALENGDWEEREEDLALAAVGTVADVVPLLGENRVIVQLGLAAFNNQQPKTKNQKPVFTLAHSIAKDGDSLTSTHIGFRIAPRINAAGRIADPSIALSALLEGGANLERLHTLNDERRTATVEMMKMGKEIMDADAPLCIAKSPAFHPGIIGLIAGKFTEKYGKPSIVCAEAGNTITCSLRTTAQYNIAFALQRCAWCLSTYGGHAMAGGCTLHKSDWEEFSGNLLEDAAQMLDPEDLVPTLPIDLCLTKKDLTLEAVRSLQTLEPFGAGNPEPRFLLKDQTLSWPKGVGSDGAHLQCRVGGIKAIGFRLGHLIENLPERADVVCRLGVDTWNGSEGVQVFIEDMGTSSLIEKPIAIFY